MRLARHSDIARDQSGATLVEFGLILAPLCVVLCGGLDLGYQSYVQTVLQGTLNDVARKASVENPDFTIKTGTLEERIKSTITSRMARLVPSGTYTLNTSSYYGFNHVGRPERLITDVNKNGSWDDGDCWEDTNPNGSFDLDSGRSGVGGANDVVFYDVTLKMPRLLPLNGLIGLPDQYTINAKTAMRTQPYANQQQPGVVC